MMVQGLKLLRIPLVDPAEEASWCSPPFLQKIHLPPRSRKGKGKGAVQKHRNLLVIDHIRVFFPISSRLTFVTLQFMVLAT